MLVGVSRPSCQRNLQANAASCLALSLSLFFSSPPALSRPLRKSSPIRVLSLEEVYLYLIKFFWPDLRIGHARYFLVGEDSPPATRPSPSPSPLQSPQYNDVSGLHTHGCTVVLAVADVVIGASFAQNTATYGRVVD